MDGELHPRWIDFRPEAVLFDMDGLMVDSEHMGLQCWRQAARELDLQADDALWHSLVGLSDHASLQVLKARWNADQVRALGTRTLQLYDQQLERGLPLKAGVLEMLEWLRAQGMPRAVVTSAQRKRTDLKLDRCGLRPYFEVVVTASDVVNPKPDPEAYLLAARQLGVDPAYCVVLEDSAPGVRAALAAGMTPIQVPDQQIPSDEVRQWGHRIVASLHVARRLLEPAIS